MKYYIAFINVPSEKDSLLWVSSLLIRLLDSRKLATGSYQRAKMHKTTGDGAEQPQYADTRE